MKDAGLVRFNINKSLINFFLTPWITGDQYQLNSPAWFMLTLFLIEVVYISFRKLLTLMKIRNEYIMLIIFLAMGIAGGGMMIFGIAQGLRLVAAKMMFGIAFYHIGYLYQSKLEKHDSINNVAYFSVIFIIQYVLMVKTDGFPYISMWNGSITTMGKNVFMPIAVSLTGIAFFLRLSRILTPSLGDSRIVRLISTSTKSIMIHHYAVIVLFNVLLSVINEYIYKLPNFDAKWTSVLYKYPGPENQLQMFCIVYIVLCLAVPVGGNKLFTRLKNKYLSKMKILGKI